MHQVYRQIRIKIVNEIKHANDPAPTMRSGDKSDSFPEMKDLEKVLQQDLRAAGEEDADPTQKK